MRSPASTCAAALCLLLSAADADVTSAAGTTKGGPVPTAELILFEEPVISAAAKHPQAARNAPSAVTVITREEIRRFGYRSLAEALRSVRGFYGTYDRNYSYVGVRGFLRPGDFNDRILLLVNGHTYNDDIYQTAYLGPEFGIDMESIDHIEVIRGPGSALYGGNALFAVINVVTLNAAGAPGVRPLVETGSYGRKRGYGSVGHEFTNGEVYTSGSVLDVDGHEDLFYREFATARHNNGFAHEVDGERAFNYFVSARYGDFHLQGGVNRREKHIPTGSYGTEFNDPDTMTTDGRQFTELSYSRDVLPRVGLTARVFYDGVDYQGVYVTRSGRQRVKNQDIAPSHWMGSELRARWDAFTNNSITTGVEVTYHPAAVLQNFDRPTGTRYLDVERSYEAWGIYAQDEWALRPNLTLVAGLRFDSYYDRLRELSPRLALIWSPLDTTTLKLLWGRAFRPPNLFEQFYATPALGYLANGRLESEKITTYEAVLEQEIGRWAQGLVALYRYDIHNLIDQTRVGDLLQYQNLDSVTAQGAEFELRVPLPRSAWLRTSYAIQEARLDDGRLLSNSPKHLGSAGLLVPLPARFQGAVDLVVVGPRRTLARRRLGTVTLVNLNLRAPPVRGFTLSGGLYNVLDQEYFDPGGAEHRQDRIQQDGLTFRVQLEYAF